MKSVVRLWIVYLFHSRGFCLIEMPAEVVLPQGAGWSFNK